MQRADAEIVLQQVRPMTATAKPKIYVESSTISYLTAPPTDEPIRLAKQILTKRWWNLRESFDLYISQMVMKEIGRGYEAAANKRIEVVKGIPILDPIQSVSLLAQTLLRIRAFPANEEADAIHVAYAAVYGMDFLITWNQKHIANDMPRRLVEKILSESGAKPPRLLTPESHFLEVEDRNVHGY